MAKKKRRNKRKRRKPQEKASEGKRNTMVMGAILVIIVGYWGISQLGGSSFPQLVTGVFYDDALISPETGRVTVPQEVVEQNFLTYVDVELENRTEVFNYLGREIILTTYRDAEYLPLVIIHTPKGKTMSGIRVCEPCSGFSFSIVQGKYLSCDTCGTLWDIETLQGVSGGCLNFPPPRLTTGLMGGVVIEAGAAGLEFAA